MSSSTAAGNVQAYFRGSRILSLDSTVALRNNMSESAALCE
jgi:hypothetical protein